MNSSINKNNKKRRKCCVWSQWPYAIASGVYNKRILRGTKTLREGENMPPTQILAHNIFIISKDLGQVKRI